MTQTGIARHRLDNRLHNIDPKELQRPHRGWVRAIREALGMTTAELGQRIGISQQSAAALEKSEERSTIRLDTLARAAAAMDCDLIYAVVPRTSLEGIVNARARKRASHLLATVGHHSRLEDQAVSDSDLEAQLEEIAADLVDRRGLWHDAES